MKVVLNESEKIFRLTPCICQLETNGNFFPCVMGITENNLIFFNDLKPDMENGEEYIYDVKIRIPLDQIMAMIYEKIHGDVNLDSYQRINLIKKDVDNSFYIYFLKADKKKIKSFLKNVKNKTDINVKKRKVDISPIY